MEDWRHKRCFLDDPGESTQVIVLETTNKSPDTTTSRHMDAGSSAEWGRLTIEKRLLPNGLVWLLSWNVGQAAHLI